MNMRIPSALLSLAPLFVILSCAKTAQGFQTIPTLGSCRISQRISSSKCLQLGKLAAGADDSVETGATKQRLVEEYKNPVTKVLANFMQKESMVQADPLGSIDFSMPKIEPIPLETLAAALDYELSESEWFVTGKVNPSYFSDEFEFEDPDVQLKGIEDYARGVNKLFDQSTSKAQIVSTVVNATASTEEKPVITVTWRLSGDVNIAFGLPIKPYIVYTDFVVDSKTSLILSQEDRFDIPPWDILLSALFPFLVGRVTSPPAPAVPKRDLSMPNFQTKPAVDLGSTFEGVLRFFNK